MVRGISCRYMGVLPDAQPYSPDLKLCRAAHLRRDDLLVKATLLIDMVSKSWQQFLTVNVNDPELSCDQFDQEFRNLKARSVYDEMIIKYKVKIHP